ncbi:MAG TPA: hypothetical protein ENN80_10330 [Candidatus Hydrogenedentes bacterium]|nr:hypothetical protein [Candidatus Hydrogenedentota bacterium]
MERVLFILVLLAIGALGALIVLNAIQQPIKKEQAWLDEELARIRPTQVLFPKPDWDFHAWHQAIAGKAALWKEIVPPPPPKPKPPPKPPNIEEKLVGVEATRQQVGDKARIRTPDNPRGDFYGVGDTINGLRIKEVTKYQVVFCLEWMGQELTTSLERR